MSTEAADPPTDDELEDAFFDPFDNSGHIKELFEKSEEEQLEQIKQQVAVKEVNKQKEQKKQNKKRYIEDSKVIKAGGNFQIQVHVIKATELQEKDLNGLSDPRVSVTIFDDTKTTKTQSNTTEPYWDQILYFDFDLEANELSTGKCLLKVMDADRLNPDDIIGYFVFDLSWIYYKKHHRVYKQYVAITNDEPVEKDDEQREGNDEIYGKLMCSITVLGPNDEQYLDSDDEGTEEKVQGLVLMPPTIIQSPYLLTVRVYKMCNLIDTDDADFAEYLRHRAVDVKNKLFSKRKNNVEFSDVDPFLYVEYGGTRISSGQIYQVQSKDKLCMVETQWEIPVMEPTFSKDIIVTVMEWDLVTKNDRIGSIKIDYDVLKDDYEIKKDKTWYIPPRWYYIYGAPPGKQRGYARKMNKGYVEGSHFRGQIYLDVTLENTKNKKSCRVVSLKKDDDDDEKKEEKQEEEEKKDDKKYEIYDENMIDYYLRCDLYEGTEINDIGILSTGELSVEIHIGNCIAKSTTQHIEDDNAFIVWNEALIHDDEKHPHDNIKHKDDKRKNLLGPFKIHKNWQHDKNIPLPNVYIYLCIEKIFGKNKRPTPVSYYCVPLRKILPELKCGVDSIWSTAPEWYDMKPNLALDKYKDNVFPGSLLLALNGGRLSSYIEQDTAPKKEVIPKPIKPKEQKYAHVLVKIHGATNLPKLDSGRGAGCDPYVKVLIDGKEVAKTDVEEETTDPKWNKKLTLTNIELHKQKMVLQVYDYDRFSKDDFAADTQPIVLNGKKMSSKSIKLYISEEAKKEDKKNKNLSSHIKISIEYKFINKPSKAELEDDVPKILTALFGPRRKIVMSDKGLSKQEMELRVHVYQAKDLQNMDVSGLSDAYLMVRFCGKKVKTKVIDNHIDPKWFETLIIKDIMVPYDENNESNPLEKTPRIICEVYDYDFLQKDETLGRFVKDADAIYMDDETCKNYKKPEPFPVSLKDANGKPVPGQVLVAFELFKSSNSKIVQLPDTLIPNPVPKWMHIITLGLRDLQTSFGLIHKPFIQFEINGIVYKTEASNVPTSRNPNFNQILAFPVELPESKDDEIFLPNLNLTLKDSLCGGAIKRVIGYASQELKPYMHGKSKIKNLDMNININEEDKEEEEPIDMNTSKKKKQKKPAASYVIGSAGSLNGPDKAHKKGKKMKDKSGQSDYTEKLLQDEKDAGYASTDAKEEEKKSLIDKPKPNERPISIIQNKLSTPEPPEYKKDRDWKKDKELTKELTDWEENLKPFTQIELQKGTNKANEKKSSVGYFKGLIAITNNRNSLNQKYNKFLKDFGKTTELYLRVYILEGHALAPRDITKDSQSSDPYLVLKIGKTTIKTRDRYIKNTLNPTFYERFEIPIKLPGASKLEISVWDYDGISDDIIGTTQIDIEDRYYSPKWRNYPGKKPREQRILRLDESGKRDLGHLDLWIELLTVQQRKIRPMINIKPPPAMLYELRVIIWKCQDVKDLDLITNASDLYITGTLISPHDEEEEQTQSTDVHMRSRNGKGSFNWRMKFPIYLPKYNGKKYPQLNLKIWDQDYLGVNDCANEWNIPLENWLKYCEVSSQDNRCKLIEEGNAENEKDKLWIPEAPKGLREYDPFGIIKGRGDGKGKIQISLELVPEKDMHDYPAGLGRDEPNINPHLPEPVGRVKWSIFHPWDALRNILGDKLLSKICCIFCCLILVSFIILILPNLFSTFLANLII